MRTVRCSAKIYI